MSYIVNILMPLRILATEKYIFLITYLNGAIHLFKTPVIDLFLMFD